MQQLCPDISNLSAFLTMVISVAASQNAQLYEITAATLTGTLVITTPPRPLSRRLKPDTAPAWI